MNQVANELLAIVGQVSPRLQAIAGENLGDRDRGPDKWSRIEILGHLIDSACNNQQKFVRMMQWPNSEFPAYQQDEWVALQRWTRADWMNMVELWQSYNRHLAHLMTQVESAALGHTISIEGVGPFTLEFVMTDYVEHLKHHLLQIFPDLEITSQFENVYQA